MEKKIDLLNGMEGRVAGRKLLEDAGGNRDDEMDAAVLDIDVDKKDEKVVEADLVGKGKRRDDEMDAAVLGIDVDRKKKDVGEAKKEEVKGKVENVQKGDEQETQQKVRDEEVDAAVLDVEQEMDKGVLVGNDEAAEKDDDDDGDIENEEEEEEEENLEELENVEFEEEKDGEDEDEGSQEDYEEMQAKEKLKTADMFAKSMVGRKKKEQRPTVHSPRNTKTHKKNSSSPHKSKKTSTSIWQVTVLTVVMALGAGLGAVPFFFVKTLSSSWRGIATAIACGVMFAASFDLVHEGQPQGGTLVILGLVLGTVFIRITQHYLDSVEDVKVCMRLYIVVLSTGEMKN